MKLYIWIMYSTNILNIRVSKTTYIVNALPWYRQPRSSGRKHHDFTFAASQMWNCKTGRIN